MERLGGEYQRTDVEIKASSIEARSKFLELVAFMAPEVFRDLLKPCRLESLPDNSRADWRIENCWIRFFLLHTKEHSWYLSDVGNLGCGPDVRKTPLLAYFDYLHKNKTQLEALTKDAESYWKEAGIKGSLSYDNLVAERTIKTFISSWKELKSKPDSNLLCKELSDWAERWNLGDDWCFDFALECLSIMKTEFADKFHPDEHYLEGEDWYWEYRQFWWVGNAWHEARLERVKLKKVWTDFEYNKSLPAETVEKLEFKYSWPRSLRRDDREAISLRETLLPFGSKPFAQFSAKMEEEFWKKFFAYFGDKWTFCVGKTDEIACEVKRFENALKGFVKKTRRTMEQVDNVEKTVSIQSDRHFRWLIDFQINKLEYRAIADQEGFNQKTITDGIKGVCGLIDLRLRQGRKRGRPPGSKTMRTGAGLPE